MSTPHALSLRAFILFAALCFAGAVRADIAGLLQLVDYVGVDYSEAVTGGEITNQFEYSEMQEFAASIRSQIRQLPDKPANEKLIALADKLITAVDSRSPNNEINAITRQLRETLMANYQVALMPRRPPDMSTAENLYQEHCASCHGEQARGDGPRAAGMEPPPIDFHDTERAKQRSLYGLYNTITLGVDGTPMVGYAQLTDAERWALAFYVGNRYITPQMLRQAETNWAQNTVSLRDAIVLSPKELENKLESGAALAAWFRTHPGILFSEKTGSIETAQVNLEQSFAAYRNDEVKRARKLALDAYLEGFELSEAALRNISRDLVVNTEAAMMAYRQGIEKRIAHEELKNRYDTVMGLLQEADNTLSGEALSPSVAFTSSLIILLREGLEAILILGAMIAFLIKTERREALRYVHAGWIIALLGGIATWAFSSYLLTITGATREVTEGATALAASAILLYVGFWMHGNANARNWSRYLKRRMEEAFHKRTLWAICLLAFLAVYREAFETVLFYQALWAQAGPESHTAITAGGIIAAGLLLLLVWLIMRFELRLPLRQFFIISASVMIVLAVIFAGQGIAALQEAGKIPVYPLPIPRIELLGIFPSSLSVALQVFIILLAVAIAVYRRRAPA